MLIATQATRILACLQAALLLPAIALTAFALPAQAHAFRLRGRHGATTTAPAQAVVKTTEHQSSSRMRGGFLGSDSSHDGSQNPVAQLHQSLSEMHSSRMLGEKTPLYAAQEGNGHMHGVRAFRQLVKSHCPLFNGQSPTACPQSSCKLPNEKQRALYVVRVYHLMSHAQTALHVFCQG